MIGHSGLSVKTLLNAEVFSRQVGGDTVEEQCWGLDVWKIGEQGAKEKLNALTRARKLKLTVTGAQTSILQN